ncbi:MAG: alpha-2-macroglobulin family protein [bacterium]
MNSKKPSFHIIGITIIIVLASMGWVKARETESMKSFHSTDKAYISLWSDVDRNVDEQKFREAESLTEKILEKAINEQNPTEWTKALTRIVFFKQTLHGYEDSVRFLFETPWPSDPLGRALLNLVGATAIKNYYSAYRWEIVKREMITTDKLSDIRSLTVDQLFQKAGLLYADAWKEREKLGAFPVKDFPECIDRGNYPDDLRNTLRDFLAYQWTEFLSDSSMWTPRDSAETFKLPFDNWIKNDGSQSFETIDDNLHPLEQAMQILSDQRAWHRSMNNKQNLLEAQLEKLRVLQRHFTQSRQKTAIETAYRQLADEFIDVPWSASAIWELAEFIRKDNRLKEAHDIAQQGWNTHPKSMGGKLCRSLMLELEAPRFSLEIMATDAPNKRSIQISHTNMKSLYFRAYRIDFEQILDKTLNQGFSTLGLTSQEQTKIIREQKPDYVWSIDLENPGDFKDHKTYSTPPIPEDSLYLIAASFDKSFSQSNNRLDSVLFQLSSIVMITSGDESRFEAWVFDARNGKPEQGVEVALYKRSWDEQKFTVKTRTNENGLAVFEHPGNFTALAVARKGTDFAYQHTHINSIAQSSYKIMDYIYLDRSVYRPGQQVHVKLISFQGIDSDYKVMPHRSVALRFMDPNGEQIDKVTLETNEFGSASTSFTIPEGRVLGEYRVQSNGGSAILRVEEYKRPTFEVAVHSPEAGAVLNSPVTVTGKADYYMGMPVSEGYVSWLVVRKPRWPVWWYWWQPQKSYTLEVAAGETQLDTDGKFSITFIPEADPDFDDKDITWCYEITATVTDSGGETRIGQATFNLGYCSVQADISKASAFFTPDIPSKFTVRRADLNGKPLTGEGRYRIVRLVQPEKTIPACDLPVPQKTLPENPITGDALQPRWTSEPGIFERMRDWPDGETIQQGKLKHDENGEAVISHKLPAGAFRVIYTTSDNKGIEFDVREEFLIVDKGVTLQTPLYLLVQSRIVTAGDTLELYIGSGYQNKVIQLEITRNRELVRREHIISSGKADLIRIPIDETLRGGFGLSAWLVHDYSLIQETGRIHVPWDDKELKLEFTTFRNLLRPGATETWTLNVKGPNSEQVSAELLAYMYDRSLDYFVSHRYPRIIDIYPTFSNRLIGSWRLRNSFTNLHSNNWYETYYTSSYRPDKMKYHSGYGIGGPGYRRGNFFAGSLRDEDGLMLKAAMAAPMEMEESGAVEESAPASGESMPQQAQPEIEMRSDFSESAFFLPHLVTDKDGNASITFTVPDSLTSWRVFVHAVTTDLKSAVLEAETETRKELMVRPYLPRFFREGDKGELRVVVNNSGDTPLSGTVHLQILDPDTEEDHTELFHPSALKLPFKAPAGRSDTVAFNLTAPESIGFHAFKIFAVTDDMTDGELRPVPVLPSRMHLAQSRFVTLKDDDSRTMLLPDLLDSQADPTLINESLVVTLEGQLFYQVLKALPYLVQYPYDCVEQTMNKFLTTGILMSLYDRYPTVAKAAEAFSKRDSRWEKWDMDDPNRRMALAETPWLQTAQGGKTDFPLLNVLAPEVTKSVRDSAIAKLQQAQNPSGAFPWFPGGPDSPFITLYLFYGFAKAHEYNIDIPKPMVKNACRYLGEYFREHYKKNMKIEEFSPEFLVFLNYVLSCFPDESWYSDCFSRKERMEMLDYTFKKWKEISPYCKAMLSLTLHRERRSRDARLIMDSIMDSAITKLDQGTFWAPEERGWLWYNDSIETHAMILRALMELDPNDDRTDGLALWLFLNKKMNHWKSTKTTSEVIYALADYLRVKDAMGAVVTASVTIGDLEETCVFDPEIYDADKCRFVISGDDVEPAMGEVVVDKTGKGYMFASMNWSYSTMMMPEEARGDFLSVTRRYFQRVNENGEMVLKPLKEGQPIEVGDQVEVHLSISAKHPMEYVHLLDPRGAGFEPETHISGYRWDLGLIRYEEIRDSCTNFFFEYLPQGEYTLKYRLRASMSGTFRVGPATLQSMYAPEFSAFSTGAVLKIEP